MVSAERSHGQGDATLCGDRARRRPDPALSAACFACACRVIDETTILNFRHLLEKHSLTEKLFAEVNRHLADQGITLRSGTLVDATIIDAPPSTKNEAKARDPETSSTKRGNDWFFGSEEDQETLWESVSLTNAHVGVDADSGIVHSLEITTAKVHPFGTLLRKALSGSGQSGLGRAPAWT